MTGVVGAHGMVARLGGDSFGVVVDDENLCREKAISGATTLRRELAAPFELSDVTVSIDPLIGVAVGPGDGTDAEELLQRADVAVSVARERPDRVARYTGRMPSDGALTPHLLTELSAALEAGDVVVHYQPQVQVATGRVIGVEALVRWQHPVHGLLPPASFIPAAERTGLIRPLTLYVLNRALDQAAQWRAAGRDLSVSVNLSVRDLLDPQFVADVRDAVLLHGVGGQGLELEITETMAMVDPQRSMAVLESLSAMGVMLSVDDYGTGYSSLAYLQRLPVRRLKIDRSFVMGMVEDEASAAIVRSTIELARNLGMTVVAEGVEDDATLLALRAMQCFAAQGFGLGRPVPGGDVLALVATIEHRVPQVLEQRVPIGRRMV
jgi:predicted signal transduction protein with EAL and GGDEF domain